MDIEALRTFVHVMRSGAIGKTSERLNLTQSAVSRRIQALEAALGTKLFEPKGRGIAPTKAGHVALTHAENALEAIDRLFADTSNLRPDAMTLRLAATPQTIETMVAPAMASIRAADIRLQLIEAGAAEVVDMILSDICDCGFTSHPTFESGLRSETIGELWLYAAHPDFEDDTPMDLTDLRDQDLLALDRSFQSRQILDASFQLSRITPILAYEGRSTRAILSLAEHRQGIAVLPSNVATHLPRARLVFEGKPLEISTTLVWRRAGPIDARAEILVALIRARAYAATQSAK